MEAKIMNQTSPQKIKYSSGEEIPIELNKVRIVQKYHLNPIDDRLKAISKRWLQTGCTGYIRTENWWMD